MSLKIIKSNEEIKINKVVGLLYGFPGAGKTSTANTTSNPVTLDFDKGAHRSAFRKDVIRIEKWEDIQSNLKDFHKSIEGYDTVIVDTVSTCMADMVEYLIRNNPKLGRNKLQLFGELKDSFGRFVQTLKSSGKDVIFVAQVKEKEENGVSVKRPDIVGGSYDIITSLCDFIGYQYYKDKVRELDFDPTEEYIGKNPMNFDKADLPNYATEPDYFSRRIVEIKERLGNISQEQKEATDTVKNLILEIRSVKTVEDLNNVVNEIKNSNYPKSIIAQVRESISIKMKEIGAVLNKETNNYELPDNHQSTAEPKESKPRNNKSEPEVINQQEGELVKETGGSFF